MSEKVEEKALDALEEIARVGRPAWKRLFKLIDQSKEQEEISSFFEEYSDNEGSY